MIITPAIGSHKNRVVDAMVWSVLLGPIGWIISACLRPRMVPLSSGHCNCGAGIRRGASFCPACGQPIGAVLRQAAVQAAPEAGTAPSFVAEFRTAMKTDVTWIALAFGIVLLIAVAVVCFMGVNL